MDSHLILVYTPTKKAYLNIMELMFLHTYGFNCKDLHTNHRQNKRGIQQQRWKTLFSIMLILTKYNLHHNKTRCASDRCDIFGTAPLDFS